MVYLKRIWIIVEIMVLNSSFNPLPTPSTAFPKRKNAWKVAYLRYWIFVSCYDEQLTIRCFLFCQLSGVNHIIFKWVPLMYIVVILSCWLHWRKYKITLCGLLKSRKSYLVLHWVSYWKSQGKTLFLVEDLKRQIVYVISIFHLFLIFSVDPRYNHISLILWYFILWPELWKTITSI